MPTVGNRLIMERIRKEIEYLEFINDFSSQELFKANEDISYVDIQNTQGDNEHRIEYLKGVLTILQEEITQ